MHPRILLVFLLVAAVGCAERGITGAAGRVQQVSVAVSPPSPEEMETWSARHPPCTTKQLPSDWTEIPLRAAPAVLRLPAAVAEISDFLPDSAFQAWLWPDSTVLTVGVSEGFQFFIGGDSPSSLVDQGSCADRIGGRLSTIQKYLLLPVDRADTLFVATIDVAIREHLWIGAGVLGRSAAAREEALAAFSTLRTR
jgi:hypothetical protein